MRPGMEDRTYFSARAVLAICVSALVNCPERSPAYPLAGYNILSNRLPENRDVKSSRSCFGPIPQLPTFQPFRRLEKHLCTHTFYDGPVPALHLGPPQQSRPGGTHGLLGLSTIDGDNWHNSPQPRWLTFSSRHVCSLGHRPKVKRSGIWVSSWCFWLHSLLQKLTTFLTSDHLEAISTHYEQLSPRYTSI